MSLIPAVEGGDELAMGGGMTLTGNLDRALRCLVIRLPGRLEGRGVGAVLEINEAELSIRSSSLSSVKALFILLLSSSSGNFPWAHFGEG